MNNTRKLGEFPNLILFDGSNNASLATNLTARQLISSVAQGTSPFSVTSTTLVTNLNADLFDGQHLNYFVTTGTTQTIGGNKTFSSILAANGGVSSTSTIGSDKVTIGGSAYSSITNMPNATYSAVYSQGGVNDMVIDANWAGAVSKNLYLRGTNVVLPILPTVGTTEDVLTITSAGVLRRTPQSSLTVSGGTGGAVGNFLPLSGGTMSGEVTFNDDGEGVTFNGGARIYKKVGTGLVLRRHTANTDPVVESNDGATSWTIFHAGNSNTITTVGTITTGTWSATTIPINKGGTGQITATLGFNALSPNTTLGDLIYHNGTDNVRLAGNTVNAKRFLTQQGNGTISAAPTWNTIASTDVSGLGSLATASSIDLSTASATGTLAAGRFPALTGDITTTAGSLATTLKNTGTAGTYRSVTTDAQGRVTAGTNPTTISGYGITDFYAQVITGFATGANSTVTNADSLEVAIEKLQGQINARLSAEADTLATVTGRGSSTGTMLTLSGIETIRITNDSGYISGFNSANTTRSGFLQFASTGVLSLTSEVGVKEVRLAVGGFASAPIMRVKEFIITDSSGVDKYKLSWNSTDGTLETTLL